MSAIAGVLVTAMVAPALAVTGIATNNSIGMFENLPEYIKPDVLSQRSEIYAKGADGNPVLLAAAFDQNRLEVGWDQISPFVKDAVVSVEDPRFYSHGGVDIISSARAAAQNAIGGDGPGASTISMQYVRNILIQKTQEITDEAKRDKAFEDATKTSVDRKLKEMKLAIGLEKEYSKDQILLGYLNISNFGGTVYGIEAAAQYYYGVSAANVSVAQAASLVAMVNEPNGLRIDQPDQPEKITENQARRDVNILPAMLREHKITQAQFDEAVATPVTPNIMQPSTGCQTANATGSAFFCDYVSYVIKNDPTFGDTEEARWEKFKTGGYRIYTTLDVDLQSQAWEAMKANVPDTDQGAFKIGSSVVTVQPGTGRVLAMVQNKDYNADPETTQPNQTSINFSTDYAYGGSSGFQQGSTYKVFTLAEWLKQGHALGEIVNGNRQTFNLSTFRNHCEGASGGSYTANNDSNQTPGNMTVTAATAASVNNAFLAMAQKLDMCDITQTAEAFGMHRADGQPMMQNVAGVLGTNEVSPLTVAASYAGIAAGGNFCTPVAIDRITDAAGNEQPHPTTVCKQAVDPNVAAAMAVAMQAVTAGGGTGSGGNPFDGHALIGKTGTTDGEVQLWFAGATTKLATAVWTGNIEGKTSLRNTSVNGTGASNLRFSVFKQYMTQANQKYGGDDFPKPTSSLLNAPQVTIPDVRGKSITEAKSIVEAAGFTFLDGGAIDSDVPAGLAAGTDPGAGNSAPKGSQLSVLTSNGQLKPVPDVSGMELGAAAQAIQAAGFKFSPATQVQQTDANCNNKVALGSTPAAGSLANPATASVALIICKKP
ncbi:transglycosylase domain-containing protein [Agreia sp. VKM Ac-1783]|uniref:transglycosylase domain-containing protein n=1 Tax=Agreia sp. VKM Ac-1783 TaxID=1938889 RepID=UPI0014829187|nr:transglycosylase domain-containing protein [Agreia sp. VKM Ac-1783]